MKYNKKWKIISVLAQALIIFVLVFVNIDDFENRLTFMRTFKANIYWIETVIENYTPIVLCFVVIWGCIAVNKKMTINLTGFDVAGFEFKLKDADTIVKNHIKHFLNTKRSLFYIQPEYDNFCEVFDSYHDIYEFLREQLLEYESSKEDSRLYGEIKEMICEMNYFLTKYQADYRRWFLRTENVSKNQLYRPLSVVQSEYPLFDSMLNDFKELNNKMKNHATTFDIDVAGWVQHE